MNLLGGLLGGVVDIGKTWMQGKRHKMEAKATAEAEVMVHSAKSTADWETLQARNAGQSWKDEWLTLLFSIPLIMAFVPSWVPYVEAGFVALENMPEWYRKVVSIIVGASFGVRSVIGFMNKRREKTNRHVGNMTGDEAHKVEELNANIAQLIKTVKELQAEIDKLKEAGK